MLKKILVSIILFGSLNGLAHEGHDQVPGTIKANHGGMVKAGKEFNLEYRTSGTEVNFFLTNHDGQNLTTNDIKLSATAKLPKGKAEVIKLEPKKDGGFVTNVDFKNAYRVEISIDVESKGKKSNFKIQVEK